MRFAVLGSLLVDDGGGPAEIGAARVRRLLAVLLVHADEVVSEDRLLDLVWDGAEPAGGGGTLRVTVSRLRKVVDRGNGDGSRLVTRAPGYALIGGRRRARRRRVRAPPRGGPVAGGLRRRRRRRGAPRPGAGVVARPGVRRVRRRGLGPSRGGPPGGTAGRGARRPGPRRSWPLGRHVEVAGDLAEVVEAHPSREQPRALLMLALYRSGRQAEALREFQAYRRFLGEELGLDPSPELVRLEARIVANDPALQAPDGGPAPARLPPDRADRRRPDVDGPPGDPTGRRPRGRRQGHPGRAGP